MRILITCGGTGGHIFPAVGFAEELKRRGYSDIVFIIDDNQASRTIIEDAGFNFAVLKVPKMPYGFSIKWPLFVVRLITSRFKAENILSGLNPDIAVGFGAYISGPVISVAKSMGIKILLHEQNVTLGRANSLLLGSADKVCFSFDNKLLGKDDKFALTGNPIRRELIEDLKILTKSSALTRLGLYPQKNTLLVLGGSKGAAAINSLSIELSRILTEDEKDLIQIIHITGEEDLELATESYKRNGLTCWMSGFCDRMGILYKAADMVICRSGAATVAEICLFGIPAIFIPYPRAGNHQRENAAVVTNAGGAIILDEEEATADRLKTEVFNLIKDGMRAKRMSSAARSLSKSDAAKRLVDRLEELTSAELSEELTSAE